MKNILTVFLLCFGLGAFAQEPTCEQKLQTLLIDKIKPYNSLDLVPYYSSESKRWGYMDRKTRQKITTPLLVEPQFFSPSLEFSYTGFCDTSSKIQDWRKKVSIEVRKDSYILDIYTSDAYGVASPEIDYQKMTNGAISGFEVDEGGDWLKSFNPRFYDSTRNKTLIESILSFKGKYYAITRSTADRNYHFNIIAQDGSIMPGFEHLNEKPLVKPQLQEEEDVWILISDSQRKYVLHALLANERKPFVFDNPTFMSQKFGYAIMSENGNTGVFDIYKLDWVVAPQNEVKFNGLYYSSIKAEKPYRFVNAHELNESRKRTQIFMLSNENVLYDLKMNKYLPKN